MTVRDLGFFFLKLMGLFYVVRSIFSFVSLVGWLTTAPSEAWPAPRLMAASSLANVAVYAILAFGCLFLTSTIIYWLFGAEPEPLLPMETPDRFLTVGVLLIGLWLFGSNVGEAFRFVIEAIWNLEGSRRPVFNDFLARAWYSSARAILTAVGGIVLMVRGHDIAAWLSPWRVAPIVEE